MADNQQIDILIKKISERMGTPENEIKSAVNNSSYAKLLNKLPSDKARQMEEIANSVASSAETIQQLSDRSTDIGQFSETIANIAEQTNLLALNAAIEAARAGEHGRGFAVVADEVRKLAEGSAQAASKIAELITSIQVDTTKAVDSMAKWTEDVKSGKEVVDKYIKYLAAGIANVVTSMRIGIIQFIIFMDCWA